MGGAAMSAAEALKSARAAGVSVTIDSDDLVLRASVPPPPAVLDGIIVPLQPETERWSAEDWQVFFDERAAIAEFDGGLPRDQSALGYPSLNRFCPFGQYTRN